ncbi:DUF1552 domain-containing protein [Nannocystis radixulma]|uniref:DUF1552 domain-containing protein n=1 Tax=Nannocystis radixulma TaxID=2995305 RepID=A0ABT5B714_9BACT|nr:DUF1552 domain-containing protein [Nannocystis radixulma]MDC0669915.1 DUF1552 domain-containing protein [Nannocystis radixulma]
MKSSTRRVLSRRAFLAGGAVAVGLPFLDVMRPLARGAEPIRPRRLLCYFVPNGVAGDAWFPVPHSTLQLSPSLAALAPVQDRVLVFSGLANAPGMPDTPGSHASGTAAFLTARKARRSEVDLHVGVSLDQRFAAAIAGATPLASLQLGCEGGGSFGACDIGFGCAYHRSISWSTPTTPLPKLTSPRLAFDVLLAGDDPSASAAARTQRRVARRSVLDVVLADVHDLEGDLGVGDRVRLDAYLDGLRALERQVDAPVGLGACKAAAPPGEPADFLAHVDMMTELMVLALACDRTRALSFMLGNAASNRAFPFLGVEGGHHDLSHHAGDPVKKAALRQVDAWQVAQFARLLQRLADTPDGDGDLLRSTIVLLGSDVGDGNNHTHHDLPIVVAGADDLWGGGRHLMYDTGTPLARLYVSILQALGLPDTSFGEDGDGPLAGLRLEA